MFQVWQFRLNQASTAKLAQLSSSVTDCSYCIYLWGLLCLHFTSLFKLWNSWKHTAMYKDTLQGAAVRLGPESRRKEGLRCTERCCVPISRTGSSKGNTLWRCTSAFRESWLTVAPSLSQRDFPQTATRQINMLGLYCILVNINLLQIISKSLSADKYKYASDILIVSAPITNLKKKTQQNKEDHYKNVACVMCWKTDSALTDSTDQL